MLNEFDNWWPAISLAILASQRLRQALTRSEVIYYTFLCLKRYLQKISFPEENLLGQNKKNTCLFRLCRL